MPNADVAWVDVLPSLQRFAPEMQKGLRGVMPKAGQEAGQEYARGFTQSAVSGVERASSQLAAARRKEADAAGSVRVAEARLQDLRDSGKAKAAQLVAAEENLAKAKRNLDVQTDAVTQSTRQLTTAQEQAARGAHQLDDGLTKAEKSSGLLSRSVGGLGASIKLGFGFLLGGGIVTGLSNLFGAADESAKIGRLTENVIRSTGGAAHVSAKQVGDLTTAISEKTGVDDEAIQSGENLLLTFTNVRNEVGKGNNIFDRATATITDMSVALGQDTSSSAIQLGKALNDPIKGVTALQRVGVSFTAAQKEQITTLVESGRTLDAQKLILAELSKEFGGAAAAAGTPFDRLKVTLGNVSEEVGGYLIPVVSKAANFIMDDLIPAARQGAAWVGDNFGPAIHVAGDALGFLVDAGEGVAHFFGWLPGPVQASVVALGAVVILSGPVTAGLTAISSGFNVVATRAIAATTSAGAFGAAAGGLVGFLGGPVGLAIAGVTLAIGLLSSKTDQNSDSTDDAAASQSELAQALMQSKGAIDANVRATAAKEARDKGILDMAKTLNIPLNQVTDAILGQGNALNDVGTQFLAYRDARLWGSDADQKAAAAANESWQALLGLADQTEGNIVTAKDLAAATSETSSATGGAVVAAQNWQTELEDTATAASDAKQATDLLKTSLDILTGAHISMAEAQSSFYAAVAQADGALKDLKGTVLDTAGNLNVQSEAGRAAQDVLFGVRDSGNQLIATMIQQGATAEQVNAKDAELRESFIKSATQMGINRQAAESLANQIYGIPAERNTQITADTSQASAAAAQLQAQIDQIHGRTVDIIARAMLPDLNGSASGSGRPGLAYGGPVPGSSPSDRADNVPIMATAGEFMQPRPAVRKYGLGFMEDVRTGRFPVERARGYADGGPIGAPISIRAELDTRGTNADLDSYAQSVLKYLEPVTGYVGALNWARSQQGKPYIWGGVGPAGYDCSGFMSAITNVIRGRSPYSRVGSTESFPWAGFAAGNNGLFNVGSTKNAGGGIGHMAGDLLGVPVESTGDHVRVGAGARSSSDGLFNTRAHLLDDGGLWPPGLGLNATGDLERVLNPPQDDYFQRFVDVTSKAADALPVQVQHDTVVYANADARQIAKETDRINRRRERQALAGVIS